MGNLKVWVPPAWANELRHDPIIEAAVKEVADGIAAKAGDGFEVVRGSNASRVNYKVTAATSEAYYRNLKENTLLKAMG